MQNNETKTTVVFTPLAWTKMWLLVDQFNSEVAWNALCRRDEEDDRIFHVEDIIVHKQRVTGGTVRTDPAEYDDWLGEFNDEIFSKIRLHGHSHYRMGAFASGLDRELQDDITAQLTDDMFYIFMIVNRYRDIWVKVCDKKDGMMRCGNAVDVKVAAPGFDSVEFVIDAQSMVTNDGYVACNNNEEEGEEDGPGEIV